jgi:hypothetical protein
LVARSTRSAVVMGSAGGLGTRPPWITGTQKTSAEILTMGRDGAKLGQDQVVPSLRIAQDAAADELLGRDPLALLIGMLLDQHFGSGA